MAVMTDTILHGIARYVRLLLISMIWDWSGAFHRILGLHVLARVT